MAKSKPKMPMPVSERAKQFSPFSPLKGLYDALAAKEKIRVPKRELSSDAEEAVNKKLTAIERGDIVTVVYYNAPDEEYLQLTGVVSKVDAVKRILQIVTAEIRFDDIYEIVTDEDILT